MNNRVRDGMKTTDSMIIGYRGNGFSDKYIIFM